MIDLEICKSSLDHEKEGRGGLVKVKAVAQVHLFAIFHMNCNSIIHIYVSHGAVLGSARSTRPLRRCTCLLSQVHVFAIAGARVCCRRCTCLLSISRVMHMYCNLVIFSMNCNSIIYMYICIYVCMYVNIYLCMYMYMYVCVCVCVCVLQYYHACVLEHHHTHVLQ